MTKEPKCNRAGCEEQGIWIPVYVIRPLGSAPSYPNKARGQVSMALCDEHKAAIRDIDDLLGGEGFAMISKRFRADGHMTPDPDVELDYELIPVCGHVDPETKAKCDQLMIEETIMYYAAGAAGNENAVTYSTKCCREHLQHINRLLMDGAINPTSVQRFSFLPKEVA